MSNDKEKAIYDLELHEGRYISDLTAFVTRVPGGWLYELVDGAVTFVPYNEEFKNEKI
jgi:hypothetical protein